MASRKGTKQGDHAEGSVHKGRLYNLSGLTLLSLSCQLVAVFSVVWVLLAPFSPPLSALIALKLVCNDLMLQYNLWNRSKASWKLIRADVRDFTHN